MTSLADVFSGAARWCVEPCDALFGLGGMPSNSVDSMVTDPPAGIAFMNRAWDDDKGGRDAWIRWLSDIMRECLRVLKPGAHAFVWALPRTSHWTATALEDAGFEIRDIFTHVFATGFPKSLNVVKATRDSLGPWPSADAANYEDAERIATEFDGFGTAAKPAAEHWILARKPLSGTVAENLLQYGTGSLNVDGCRIGMSPEDFAQLAAGVDAIRARGGSMDGSWKNSSDLSGANPANANGRWPANFMLSHADGCEQIGVKRIRAEGGANIVDHSGIGYCGTNHPGPHRTRVKPRDADGNETVESWDCVPGCPARLLDEQSGDRPGMSGGGQHRADYGGGMFGAIDSTATARGDRGGASRFFFTGKASRAEKDAGLDDFEPASAGAATGRKDGADGLSSPRAGAGRTGGAKNTHPTPKRVELMRYLTRFVTPPRGLVLDPFCGSGSGGIAAMHEGMRFVGLELEPLHVDFARARIAHVIGGSWQREVKLERPVEKKQPSLFDAIGGVAK